MPANLFDSEIPIALLERPGDTCTMTLTIGDGGETSVGLPFPGVDTPILTEKAHLNGVSQIVVNV